MSILKFIRWLCGYVRAELKGDNTTAFLNFCLQKKLSVWNVQNSNNKIYLNMMLKDYKNIRSLRREFGHKVCICHKKFFGLPKKVIYINRRKSIAVGFAVFFSVLFAFSQFIWDIEIVGNNKIEKQSIISAYTELGVYNGMPRSELDSYSLRDRLPLIVRDISWCSFNLEGTKLTINITEIKESDKSNKKQYSNLIASADGIIKKIDIVSGNKSVQIGQVVSKGDVLVSGAPELNMQSFTYSDGEVLAETYRTISVKLPNYKTVVKKSGYATEKAVLEIFKFMIPLYLDSVHFDYESELSSEKVSFLGDELPIIFHKRKFTEVTYEISERTKEEIFNDATAELLKEIKKEDIRKVSITDYTISEEQDSYLLVFKCKCIENIAQVKKINVAS